MEEPKSDYHDANSFPLNDLDQTTSTTYLSQEKKQRTPLKPVVQHYLKALIKITRLETKATHHLETLKKALEDQRPPKGLTPNIKHNISKAPADLVIEWNSILHETGEKLTKVLINYWQDQQTIQQLEFEHLRAELEEQEQINQETWQQVTDILNKIKEGVQEEQKTRRPTSNRIIKQASKMRLIEPTQSQSSTPMSSSTQSTNLSLEPKPQRLKESKKQDALRVEKQPSQISVASIFQKQKEISSGGTKFYTNTYKGHPAIILQDYLLFDQKLRLQYYFMDKEKNTTNDKPTTLKQSTEWTPPSSQDQNFDSYRNLTQREILKELDIPPSYRRFNLPKSERQAIKTLANNDKITIKPADKGGKIVIQDTTDYISECERQLENTMHYKRLYTDPTAELNSIIKNKLEQGIKDGHISTEEFEALYNRDPRTSNFYTLPKIHKINNPGRPIVNSIGSITEKISAYVDENIKYFAKLVPSYIKDTGHFLNIIKTIEIQEEDLLVTVDVSYTNIRHQDGIKALKHWLIENGTPIEKAEFIGVLAKLVLTSNYFTFNGKLYLQKQGTAMGT